MASISHISPISPSEISSYFEKNSAIFVDIVKNFDMSKLNNPVIIRFLSYVAECTDTKYNVAYGGEPVTYDENIWYDHFTDDFWMVLFLFYNYFVMVPLLASLVLSFFGEGSGHSGLNDSLK